MSPSKIKQTSVDCGNSIYLSVDKVDAKKNYIYGCGDYLLNTEVAPSNKLITTIDDKTQEKKEEKWYRFVTFVLFKKYSKKISDLKLEDRIKKEGLTPHLKKILYLLMDGDKIYDFSYEEDIYSYIDKFPYYSSIRELDIDNEEFNRLYTDKGYHKVVVSSRNLQSVYYKHLESFCATASESDFENNKPDEDFNLVSEFNNFGKEGFDPSNYFLVYLDKKSDKNSDKKCKVIIEGEKEKPNTIVSTDNSACSYCDAERKLDILIDSFPAYKAPYLVEKSLGDNNILEKISPATKDSNKHTNICAKAYKHTVRCMCATNILGLKHDNKLPLYIGDTAYKILKNGKLNKTSFLKVYKKAKKEYSEDVKSGNVKPMNGVVKNALSDLRIIDKNGEYIFRDVKKYTIEVIPTEETPFLIHLLGSYLPEDELVGFSSTEFCQRSPKTFKDIISMLNSPHMHNIFLYAESYSCLVEAHFIFYTKPKGDDLTIKYEKDDYHFIYIEPDHIFDEHGNISIEKFNVLDRSMEILYAPNRNKELCFFIKIIDRLYHLLDLYSLLKIIGYESMDLKLVNAQDPSDTYTVPLKEDTITFFCFNKALLFESEDNPQEMHVRNKKHIAGIMVRYFSTQEFMYFVYRILKENKQTSIGLSVFSENRNINSKEIISTIETFKYPINFLDFYLETKERYSPDIYQNYLETFVKFNELYSFNEKKFYDVYEGFLSNIFDKLLCMKVQSFSVIVKLE